MDKISIQLSASIMCCNMLQLQNEILLLEKSGCETLHIDVMDGRFVKNFAMNFYEIEAIKKITSMPLDIHLMLERPSDYIDKFIDIFPNSITFHIESPDDINGLIAKTKQSSIKAGVALNHNTSLDVLSHELLKNVDQILIMSTYSGFSGQSFIGTTYEKIRRLKARLYALGMDHLTIQVDGAISLDNILQLYNYGATAYVLGTSGLFIKGVRYDEQIQKMRHCILKSIHLINHDLV